jgi:hypothetical protein
MRMCIGVGHSLETEVKKIRNCEDEENRYDPFLNFSASEFLSFCLRHLSKVCLRKTQHHAFLYYFE